METNQCPNAASADAGERSCRCATRGYVRALEEDDWGFPDKIEPLATTGAALLGRCRRCGQWWEYLPHWVYGYAWYQTEPSFWATASETAAIGAWSTRRQDPEA